MVGVINILRIINPSLLVIAPLTFLNVLGNIYRM